MLTPSLLTSMVARDSCKAGHAFRWWAHSPLWDHFLPRLSTFASFVASSVADAFFWHSSWKKTYIYIYIHTYIHSIVVCHIIVGLTLILGMVNPSLPPWCDALPFRLAVTCLEGYPEKLTAKLFH